MTDQETITQLSRQLGTAMGRDHSRFRRRLAGLKRRLQNKLPLDRGISELSAEIAASQAAAVVRSNHQLALKFDPMLPISERVEDIRDALVANPVIIVAGETGSGKTTQLPKICLLAGLGVNGWIGCTQPRRIAARTIAARLVEEMGGTLGGPVGYQVRFDQRVGPQSLIKVMTDGVLLAETQRDRWLENYDVLIIDEAHERSLNIDFILGYLKRILPRRPGLKVIITSATIDTERFSKHFDDAPVIQVSGRGYPVELRYRSLLTEPDSGKSRDLSLGISEAVLELNRLDANGDILVFLPGERDIREAQDHLNRQAFRNTEVLPLYGRLSTTGQNRIFHPGRQRRIILATNVAETSLTVPRIRFVIDSGLARISCYSHRSKVQRLPIEAISQASANQRTGRCGRLGPGVCIRLYDEQEFLQRSEYTLPEILRTNLAAVILQMEALGLGDFAEFPFLDRPEERMVSDGYQLLFELGAHDAKRQISAIGRQLAQWPLDVRLARLVLAARQHDCLAEGLVLAAALSIQDPRERPLEAQQQADQAHAKFADTRSDFVAWINLWKAWGEARETHTNRQQRAWCRDHFLNFMRMREWLDVHRQLIEITKDSSWVANSKEADYESLHKALVTAFIGQIALKDEQHYLGARQRRMSLFPGSGLFKSKPQWVVSAFLVETARVYARTNAKIDPAWAEQAAKHLVKRRYFDPYWSQKAGRVLGFERVTLYGLPLVERRRIHFGPHDPVLAREIFILEALVNGRLRTRGKFLQHNRALINSLEVLEHKQRRRDILVDEQTLCAIFDQRIPARLHNAVDFEAWRQQAEREQPDLLMLSEADLTNNALYGVSAEDYPDTWSLGGVSLDLDYSLAPGQQNDGVSLQVPLHLLGSLRAETLEHLVPGMRLEKVTALIKSLPKALRRNFVPAPDHAREFLAQNDADDGSLVDSLARWMARGSGLSLSGQDFNLSQLPEHLRFNIKIIDGESTVAVGRDLLKLQQDWTEQAREKFLTQAGDKFYQDQLSAWPAFDLPDSVTLETGIVVYPALVDQEDAVGIRLFEQAESALAHHQLGLRRLLELTQGDKVRYLARSMDLDNTMCLQYAPVDRCEVLRDDLVFAVSWSLVQDFDGSVRDQDRFSILCREFRQQILLRGNQLVVLLRKVLNTYHSVRMALRGQQLQSQHPQPVNDMSVQLEYLIYPGFLTEVDAARLLHYPRYLEGMLLRIDRLRQDAARDARRQGLLQGFQDQYFERTEALDDYPAQLDAFHWLLEEYRISIFAQPLKTAAPVSPKRLKTAWRTVPLPG